MQSLTAARTLARRSSVGLARCASIHSRVRLAATCTPLPPAARPSPWTPSAPRLFSQTAVRAKKGSSKKDKAEKVDKKDKKGGGSAAKAQDHDEGGDDDGGFVHPQADPADPYKFADVESRWQRTDAHHEDKLKALRRSLGGGEGEGGGVDVEAIGATPVKESDGRTVPLSQMALVIPRGAGGRLVELRMHTPASRKAIVRAVQAAPLFRGQQPQPDADDELVLLIKLGGAAEAPADGARRLHDLANAWRAQIRRATARRQKTHQTWKKDGSVRPDDLHRLDKDLLKAQEKRMAHIDAAEKDALRQLERARR